MLGYQVYAIHDAGAPPDKTACCNTQYAAERAAEALLAAGDYAAGVKREGDASGPWLYLTCKGGPSRVLRPVAGCGEEDYQ